MNDESVTAEATTSKGAVWSLVMGILGLMCLGPLGGIPAIVCGHVARGKIAKSGGALQGEGLALAGLIMGYVATAMAIVIVPMMAAIAIPSFVKARDTSVRNACINNLRHIDSAKEQWAMAGNKTSGTDVVLSEVNQYIKGNATPICPAGGSYTYAVIGTDPQCSKHGGL
jgi:hypothetical protein